MPDDLGARLMRAGLVTRDQLARALAESPAEGGRLAEALVAQNLSEDALAGFFLAQGFGPLQRPRELERARPEATRRISGEMAHGLLVLPLSTSPAGLVVAMVDPTDEHARGELQRVTGEDVVPAVARPRDLREALVQVYGAEPPAHTGQWAPSDDEEDVVPLVRAKQVAEHARSGPALAESPRSDPERTGSSPAVSTDASAEPEERPVRTTDPWIAQDRWDDLDSLPPREIREDAAETLPEGANGPGNPTPERSSSGSGPLSSPPADLGGTLASIRAADSRDAIVRRTCEGASSIAPAVLFLARRQGMLKGWDGIGNGLTRDAVRNLWIPLSSQSVLSAPLERGEAYRGPYGESPADKLLRSTLGGRGSHLQVQPVVVDDRVVGALCVDAPRYGATGRERIEVLARVAGESFKSLLLTSKKG